MLRITKSARDILVSILEDNPGFDLRLFCDAFGRTSPELGLTIDHHQERDHRLQVDGLEIYLDEKVRGLDGEQVIDYHPGHCQGLVLRSA